MRPRALALLLPLTAADYVLWDWSVGGSHDLLALASGMTLLPLAALSLGLLGLSAVRLLARGLRGSSTMTRSVRPARPRSTPARARAAGQVRTASAQEAQASNSSQPPARKLAA